MSDDKRIVIPSWVLKIVELAIPAAIAIFAMYVKVALIERDLKEKDGRIGENKDRIVKLEALVETRGERIRDNAARIGVLETKQAIMEKSISEALGRIESDVKDVKRDMKEIQNRSTPK